MSTHTIPDRSGHRTPPLLGISAAGCTLTIAGLALTTVHQAFGLATIGVGAVTGLIGSAIYSNQRTLDRLHGLVMADLAQSLPLLPSTSAHPRRDLVMLPAGLPAVVALPEGGWGVIPQDVAHAALEWAGFDGAWHRIAEPTTVYQPDDPVSMMRRIPRDGAAILVDCAWPTPHGVTGRAIRDRAEGFSVTSDASS